MDISEIRKSKSASNTTKVKGSSKEKISYFLNYDYKLLSDFGDKHKERFFSEMGLLLNAGVDLQTALEITSQSTVNKKLLDIYNDLKLKIVAGKGLSEAMLSTKKFNNFDSYSILIGENTGELSSIFIKLQNYYSRKIIQKRKILSALSYPAIVLSITVMAVIFMLKFVVPMFADTLIRFGGELPYITKLVINISNHISTVLFIACTVSALIFIWYRKNKESEGVQKVISNIALKIPYLGSLLRKIHILHFSQSMELLLASHIGIVDSIELTQKMTNFYPLSVALEKIRTDLLKGSFFHTTMENQTFFDKSTVMLIKIGEEINQLDKIFTQITKQYENEIDYQSNQLLTLLEPITIIILALFIGIILIAMYLPMFKIGAVIQ